MIVSIKPAFLFSDSTDLAFPHRRRRRIPKGFRNKAQGCEKRATLGLCVPIDNNPERVAAHGNGNATRAQPRWGCETPATFTQGSSSLATLGFVAESLWDSFPACTNCEWLC